MPVVRVSMWTGRTKAQKAELARLITEALVTVAHTRAESVNIIFEEVSRENWAQAGLLVSERQPS